MSLRTIRSLYSQKGHLFYRDGLTFSQHSAQSFYYVKHFQQNQVSTPKDQSILLLASTFHNIGKMIDKTATSRFTAGFLNIKSFPLVVSHTIYLQDMAKRYLFTEDKNLFLKSRYIQREIASSGSLLSEAERQYFMNEKMYPIALLVAENDIYGLKNKHDKLSDQNWEELEVVLEHVFQS